MGIWLVLTQNVRIYQRVLVSTDAHLDLFDSESEDASDYEEVMEV
jgi:hypothetical protein